MVGSLRFLADIDCPKHILALFFGAVILTALFLLMSLGVFGNVVEKHQDSIHVTVIGHVSAYELIVLYFHYQLTFGFHIDPHEYTYDNFKNAEEKSQDHQATLPH